ncbi:MAG: N-acetylglucosamine 6-phosphate deacetylase [Cryptosporangiaceae bacterium]|nr:N-acetylglucosamine 6-phosphate deacetylase [Cryptosporangiaceae bacterium]
MLTLGGARVVLPDRVLDPGVVRIDGDRIVAVERGATAAPTGAVDLTGHTLVPGLVDLHVHGGGGGSFPAADPDGARTAAAYHLRHGTTSTVASLVTAAPEDLHRAVTVLAGLCEDGTLAGIHLEGPFLAAARCGAHDPVLLRAPDLALLDRLLAAGRGHVRHVTVAPELPGAMELIARLRDRGVVAAVGHTDATYAQTTAAFVAGAGLVTHLFNGMRPLHHRDPGPVAAALARPGVVCEVIGDGVHLADQVVTLLFATLGPDRIALVTDAMAAAGCADGAYTLGTLAVAVRDGVARTATGAIAGGTATLADVLRRAVRAGVPLLDAVRAATLTPARAVGLEDRGAITPGRRADLCVLDADLRPAAVLRAGAWVSSASWPRGPRRRSRP